MRRIFALAIACFALLSFANAQDWSTWNADTSSIPMFDGQAWQQPATARYARLPNKAENTVPKNVWDLSRNSTGVIIRFKTNSDAIRVVYTVKGGHAFPHMPATGVSGVDLYGKDRDGRRFWFPGKYSFGDSISYAFSNLLSYGDTTSRVYEYQLYLPLYNTVASLQISYRQGSIFSPMQKRAEKPIVVYGTSIAQGGCASRPGLAWTSILERSLDRPLINLGFSGNGRLDSAVVELLTEIDAKIYVLDCLPNLTEKEKYPDEEIKRRILQAVKILRRKRADVPIVLSEHSAGSVTGSIYFPGENRYTEINNVMQETVKTLKAAGEKNLYLLKNSDIAFTSDATVDGIHPADIGMQQNAMAYEKLLRSVLLESTGSVVTTKPVSQSRDNFYFFPDRHQQILDLKNTMQPKTVYIGNSIVHMWGGEPAASILNGNKSWQDLFAPMNTLNLGYGWDRVENVLWRIQHDELDGYKPEKILVMIGTNNIGLNSDEEIIVGLDSLYAAIRQRQPDARFYVIGILPRRDQEKRVALLNMKISHIVTKHKAVYANPGTVFLKADGRIDESLFGDGLHPNEEGYAKLASKLKTILK